MNPLRRGIRLQADIGPFATAVVVLHGEVLHLGVADFHTEGIREVSADDLAVSHPEYPAPLVMFTDGYLVYTSN